jgi:uncharacterized phage protein (TIGR02218 family)
VKSLPAALSSHLTGDVTTLAVCWRLVRVDGVLILGTEHDRDVTIAEGGSPTNIYAGTYLTAAGISGSSVTSTAGLEVDNLEVDGATTDDLQIVDLSADDIEAGLLDNAEVVIFLVNWSAPDDGQLVLRRGNLGAIKRTSEGRYSAELRGLTQKLSQTIVKTYSVTCDAELGDTRCGVDLDALAITGTVTSVTSRRRFDSTLAPGSPTPANGDYVGGLLTFTSGDNSGYSRELKKDAAAGTLGELEVFEAFPADIAASDTFELRPGCDKSLETCRDRFANLANFRGHAVYTPGLAEILRGPTRSVSAE